MVEQIKNKDLEKLKTHWAALRRLCGDILGIPLVPSFSLEQSQKLKAKLSEREGARKNKQWSRADEIRKEIEAQGMAVEDTPLGPIVTSRG